MFRSDESVMSNDPEMWKFFTYIYSFPRHCNFGRMTLFDQTWTKFDQVWTNDNIGWHYLLLCVCVCIFQLFFCVYLCYFWIPIVLWFKVILLLSLFFFSGLWKKKDSFCGVPNTLKLKHGYVILQYYVLKKYVFWQYLLFRRPTSLF